MKYLILALLLLSPMAHATPPKGLLVCSCGDPVMLLISENGMTKIIPANQFNAKTMILLRKFCKGKSPVPVWKAENITGKSCPISL